MTNALTIGQRIARDLCEMDAPENNAIEVSPLDVSLRIDAAIAELEAQNARLLVAIEAKDVALKSCEYADDSTDPEMCGPYFNYESILEALALTPSAELLEARDRKRDAKLLRTIANSGALSTDGVKYVFQQANSRADGSWKPELGD